MKFDDLWRYIVQRSQGFPTVQEYHELQYVFNLIQGCESYLEAGTAEGNSLYVLSHALKPNSEITYIDWDEKHTREPRELIVRYLESKGFKITPLHGNTHDPEIVKKAQAKYDVVLIDAGHKFEDVITDATNYGKLATKFIIFHDVQLPEVERAFSLYQKETGHTGYKVINSETFGYGILEIK